MMESVGMSERRSLYKAVESPEHASSMETSLLNSLKIAHDLEITDLRGKLDRNVLNDRPQWRARTRHALNTLKLQCSWIDSELYRRDRDQRQSAHQRKVEEDRAKKLERIANAQQEDRLRKESFFAVAREVLGMEMYQHLWELARVRSLESATSVANSSEKEM